MANEKRLIDANALIEKFKEHRKLFIDAWQGCVYLSPGDKARVDELDNCIADVINAPTVDAVEVVHGYWEKEHDDLGIDRGWKCSHCNGSVYEMTYESYQYCPHCGAKMDGGNEDA